MPDSKQTPQAFDPTSTRGRECLDLINPLTTLPEIKELLTEIRDDQRRLVKLAEVSASSSFTSCAFRLGRTSLTLGAGKANPPANQRRLRANDQPRAQLTPPRGRVYYREL